MNPWLILSPLGMLLVGVVSIAYWRRKSCVEWRLFLFGGLTWLASVSPKFLMDYTITPAVSQWLRPSLSEVMWLAALGFYVGLRTGLLENGVTYLVAERTSFRESSVDEAMAFGVGFGAFEAILLALPSLIQLSMFIANPTLIDEIPPEYREAIIAQLESSTWIVFAPILERLFTLFAHLFAVLLVFFSVRHGDLRFLLYAVVYKSVLDAVVPYLQWILESDKSLFILYLSETWVVALGAIAIFGIRYLRKNWKPYQGYDNQLPHG